MKTAITASLLMVIFSATVGVAAPAGRPGGTTCAVDRVCSSNLCLKRNPSDRLGTCCGAQSCAQQGLQCGTADNGCGTPIDCGVCGPGTLCIDNQCAIVTTTTTSTTTTTVSITTTTLPCSDASCGSSPLCNPQLGCYRNQTTEASCGECVFDSLCLFPCTSSQECGSHQVCIINTCCGASGVCADLCDPSSVTTTTVPGITTTTVPGITTTTVPGITTTTVPEITTTSITTTTMPGITTTTIP